VHFARWTLRSLGHAPLRQISKAESVRQSTCFVQRPFVENTIPRPAPASSSLPAATHLPSAHRTLPIRSPAIPSVAAALLARPCASSTWPPSRGGIVAIPPPQSSTISSGIPAAPRGPGPAAPVCVLDELSATAGMASGRPPAQLHVVHKPGPAPKLPHRQPHGRLSQPRGSVV
jgi:hypothetical protein